MKAEYATQPDPKRFGNPITPFHFSFTLRWRNWKLTENGIFRWWGFKAVKANKKGIHAIRYGWKRMH
jgi:hypothetical protein